ncbi:hypothetical protein [Gluconobacter oxydans]|uniref:hypothetical protein n=1 Tax=Gluconobacter oxydans TaxID=442 RepID=UPI00155885E8|nr:hypothetical protein [Gluconobacter oxydans]
MKYRAMWTAVAVLALSSLTTAASAADSAGVTAFIRDRHLTRYSVALSDLNGDKQSEALIYAMATTVGNGQADLCGSGGCTLYVLSLTPSGYRLVTSILATRPPIRVLSSTTHGWHDLGVSVAGGGITAGYEARLCFDGHRYPSNPTVPPATRATGKIGKIIIESQPKNR